MADKLTTKILLGVIAAMFSIIMAGGGWAWSNMEGSVAAVKSAVSAVDSTTAELQLGQIEIKNDIELKFQTANFTDSLGLLKRIELEARIEKCELEIDALKSSQP